MASLELLNIVSSWFSHRTVIQLDARIAVRCVHAFPARDRPPGLQTASRPGRGDKSVECRSVGCWRQISLWRTSVAAGTSEFRVTAITHLLLCSAYRLLMNKMNSTLAATLIATAVGIVAWFSGESKVVWPAHPQIAAFLVTVVVSVIVKLIWPQRQTS